MIGFSLELVLEQVSEYDLSGADENYILKVIDEEVERFTNELKEEDVPENVIKHLKLESRVDMSPNESLAKIITVGKKDMTHLVIDSLYELKELLTDEQMTKLHDWNLAHGLGGVVGRK